MSTQQKCVAIFALLCCFAVLLVLIFSSVDIWWDDEDGITEENCSRNCRIMLVENVPEDLYLPVEFRGHLSLSVGIRTLLNQAKQSVEVVSPVWNLKAQDVENVPSRDKEVNSAEVHFVNMTALTRGRLQSSFMVVDRRHFYMGSADMDWRSFSKRKELGVLVYNCSCLALDLHRVFSFYWQLHDRDYIPSIWSKRVSALYGRHEALELQLNTTSATAYVSTSPDVFCPKDRTRDIEAIHQVIQSAQSFVFISVTDYLPLVNRSFRGTTVTRYWSLIDDVIREAVVLRRVRVRLLVSFWTKTHPLTFNFLTSLKSLCLYLHNCSLEVKFFRLREQKSGVQLGLNHNKYIVTDSAFYIGSHDWVGSDFALNAGVGLVVMMRNSLADGGATILEQMKGAFQRDWTSHYAKSLLGSKEEQRKSRNWKQEDSNKCYTDYAVGTHLLNSRPTGQMQPT
uniref:Phospholipase D family member 5 n=1 Tax=Cynoglossus semilaevis TaxID=244447 RepID=A0A3P8VQ65_CYNSE